MGTPVTRAWEAAAARARLRVAADAADGRPPVLELEGEFDLDTVPEMDRFLRRTLGPLYHQDHLVMDLSRTTFIDSSFVSFIVRLSAAQRAKRRELLLVRPEGQVRRVFGIVGLANVVPVFETIEAAVDSVLGGHLPGHPAGVQRGGRLGCSDRASPTGAAGNGGRRRRRCRESQLARRTVTSSLMRRDSMTRAWKALMRQASLQ